MIFIYYLAAGNSVRFGENKLLFPFRGEPLFRHGFKVLQNLCQSREDCRLSVISQYWEILDYAEKQGAKGILSSDSKYGMSYTVRCAIQNGGELRAEDRLLFVCADQPYLSLDTMGKLLSVAKDLANAVEENLPVAACAFWNGIKGNPVMFSSFLAEELCSLRGDSGGKAVLKRYPDRCLWIPCLSGRELMDLDYRDSLIFDD